MATKKKTTVAAETEPSVKKRVTKSAKPAASAALAEPKAAPKAKSAAATHKSAARRATKSAAVAPVFDAESHRDEIAVEAYYLWMNRGCAHGHEHEDWLQAINVVRARRYGA